MHPNAKIRLKILEEAYALREEHAGSFSEHEWFSAEEAEELFWFGEGSDGESGYAMDKTPFTSVLFGLAVLTEIGHLEQQGSCYRITGAGVVAYEQATGA